jgi:hypothetical protein
VPHSAKKLINEYTPTECEKATHHSEVSEVLLDDDGKATIPPPRDLPERFKVSVLCECSVGVATPHRLPEVLCLDGANVTDKGCPPRLEQANKFMSEATLKAERAHMVNSPPAHDGIEESIRKEGEVLSIQVAKSLVWLGVVFCIGNSRFGSI